MTTLLQRTAKHRRAGKGRLDDPTKFQLAARPGIAPYSLGEELRRPGETECTRITDLRSARGTRREAELRGRLLALTVKCIQHGDSCTNPAVVDRRTGLVEQRVNLGQPRIEKQDAARIQLGELLTGIQVEKRNTAIEVIYELPVTTELVKKRNSSANAAPLQHRSACIVGHVVTPQSQRDRQSDTK